MKELIGKLFLLVGCYLPFLGMTKLVIDVEDKSFDKNFTLGVQVIVSLLIYIGIWILIW